MEKELNNKTAIRRYLLGDISDEERQQIECRILTDGEYFGQVSVLEEELVDEYVRGKLSAKEQRKFEYYFLSNSEGVEQVRLATDLRTYALKTRPSESRHPGAERVEPTVRQFRLLDYFRPGVSVNRYALAVLILLFLLAGSWLIINLRQSQNQVAQLRAQSPVATAREQELQERLAEQQARNDRLVEDLKREQDQRAKLEQELLATKGSQKNSQEQNTLAAIILTPGRVRGSSNSSKLVIRPTVERVQFQLVLRADSYDSFKASLKTGNGQVVRTSAPLKAQSLGRRKVVQVSLPANLLSSGDFLLQLQGTAGDGNYEEAGNYYFRVVKE
jgi:hypothetical protein